MFWMKVLLWGYGIILGLIALWYWCLRKLPGRGRIIVIALILVILWVAWITRYKIIEVRGPAAVRYDRWTGKASIIMLELPKKKANY